MKVYKYHPWNGLPRKCIRTLWPSACREQRVSKVRGRTDNQNTASILEKPVYSDKPESDNEKVSARPVTIRTGEMGPGKAPGRNDRYY